jgi:hypothetical protein
MELTLISITDDQHFIVIRGEFNMAIPLLDNSIQGPDLIFPSVPTRKVSSAGKSRDGIHQ